MDIAALTRRMNLRRIGVPIVETMLTIESEWDAFSLIRRMRTRESVKTGTRLFKTFNATTVTGRSVVDGEMYEQTYVKRINGHERNQECTHQNIGIDHSDLGPDDK
jgi:hypothetical protein